MNHTPKTSTPEKTYLNGTTSLSAHVEGGRTISPANLTATISLPNGAVIEFGTLSMISISSHREKFPVTQLNTIGPVGYTKGHRLIAGTLVFNVFDRSAFSSVLSPLEAIIGYPSNSDKQKQSPKLAFFDMQADELPQFDIHMIYGMDDGTLCYEGLRGITILDFGSVRSIDMLQTQESYSYFAREVIPLQRLTDYIISRSYSKSNLDIATGNSSYKLPNPDLLLFNPLEYLKEIIINNSVTGQYSQKVTVSTTSSGPLSGIPVKCIETGQILISEIGGVTFTQPVNIGNRTYHVDSESKTLGRGTDSTGKSWPININQSFTVSMPNPVTLNVSCTLI